MFQHDEAITVWPCDSNSTDAVSLIDELSNALARITGRDGRSSFSNADMALPRSTFLIAYENGRAVGCGALRPIEETVCEIKRMYARNRGRGIGSRILTSLEEAARVFRYHRILLETGVQNQSAIAFYLKNGYSVCANYGKYVGRPECVCFEKILPFHRECLSGEPSRTEN